MDNNLKIILQEFDELKGQFVIGGNHNVVRLVAVGEDDMDYYWITYDGRKLTWETCVGSIVPLKGYIRDEDYKMYQRISKLNHLDKMLETAAKHGVSIEDYTQSLIDKFGPHDKLLTEIVFDDVTE